MLAFTRFAFVNIPAQFWMALIFNLVSGVCIGFNAVTTQSLRRKLCTQSQFPEVVGLELLVGKFVDWSVGTLSLTLALSGLLTFEGGMIISGFVLILLAGLQLFGQLRDV